MLEELVDFFAPQAQLSRVQLRFKPRGEHIDGGGGCPPDQADDFEFDDQCAAGDAQRRRADFIGCKNGDAAVMDVIDTGSGIPPEAIEQDFRGVLLDEKKRDGIGVGDGEADRAGTWGAIDSE